MRDLAVVSKEKYCHSPSLIEVAGADLPATLSGPAIIPIFLAFSFDVFVIFSVSRFTGASMVKVADAIDDPVFFISIVYSPFFTASREMESPELLDLTIFPFSSLKVNSSEFIFWPFGKGVSYEHRWTLNDDTLLNFPIIRLPLDEQSKINEKISNLIYTTTQVERKLNQSIIKINEQRVVFLKKVVPFLIEI